MRNASDLSGRDFQIAALTGRAISVRTGVRTSATRTAGMVSRIPFSVVTKVETTPASRC